MCYSRIKGEVGSVEVVGKNINMSRSAIQTTQSVAEVGDHFDVLDCYIIIIIQYVLSLYYYLSKTCKSTNSNGII